MLPKQTKLRAPTSVWRKNVRAGWGDIEKCCRSEREQALPTPSTGDWRMQVQRGQKSASWMAFLSDEAPMSSLSIPGTHDSAAFTRSWPFIATQKMDIFDQLNAGIRYFDLRCGIRDDVVEMVHGPTLLGLTLERVLGSMYAWLAVHPTEALIVQIKRDRKGERSSVHLAEAIPRLLARNSERWRTANTIPVLGELRGKIQLLRRFVGPDLDAYGINVTQWQDNPPRPFTIYTRPGFRITIQDHYNFPDPEPLPSLIAKKGGNVSGLLNRASADSDDHHFFINFTSAFEFNLYYQLPPRSVAVGGWHRFRWEDGMNLRLRTFLTDLSGSKKRFGIVAMDFPELGTDGLIAALIQSNFDLEDEQSWAFLAVSFMFVIAIVAFLVMIWFAGGVLPDCQQYFDKTWCVKSTTKSF